MRTIEQWYDGAKIAKKDMDESTIRPPSVPDWKKLGPIIALPPLGLPFRAILPPPRK